MSAAAAETPQDTPHTLGDLAVQRDALREQMRAVQQEEQRLKALLDENEAAIIALLDEQGVSRSGVGPYSMSISETVVGNVENWDSVYEYILTNNAFHLLQRRLANAAYKEILDGGEAIEGIVPFTKRSLNFRKVSGK